MYSGLPMLERSGDVSGDVYLDAYHKSPEAGTALSPAGLVRLAATEAGIAVDGDSFLEVETRQENFRDSPYSYDGCIAVEGQSLYSDAIAEVCRGSMTAVYVDRGGALKAAWFADDSNGSPYDIELASTNVVSGSLEISKPDMGYQVSDFRLKAPLAIGEPESIVAIDTGKSGSFPGPSSFAYSGQVYAGSFQSSYSDQIAVIVNGTDISILLAQFRTGMLYELRGSGIQPFKAYLDSVAPNYSLSTSVQLVFRSSSIEVASTYQIQACGPAPLWRSYVAGDLVRDYDAALDMWSEARLAREALGVVRKAPSDVCELSNPLWGSDKGAVTTWMRYLVHYCAQAKSTIRVSCELNPSTVAPWLMSLAKVTAGPLASNPITGRIVEVGYSLSEARVSFTVLGAPSDRPLADMLMLTGAGEPMVQGSGWYMQHDELLATEFSQLDLAEVSMLAIDGSDGKGGYIDLKAFDINGGLVGDVTASSSNPQIAEVSLPRFGIIRVTAKAVISGGLSSDVVITAQKDGVTSSCLVSVYNTLPSSETIGAGLWLCKGGKGGNTIVNIGNNMVMFSGLMDQNGCRVNRAVHRSFCSGSVWLADWRISDGSSSVQYAPYFENSGRPSATMMTRSGVSYSAFFNLKNPQKTALQKYSTVAVAFFGGGLMENGQMMSSSSVSAGNVFNSSESYLRVPFHNGMDKYLELSTSRNDITAQQAANPQNNAIHLCFQNYLRYHNRGGQVNYTVIPNIGTLGEDHNLAANNVQNSWFSV
jgi:hypothetical protein